jgi:hypothetical protein
MADRRPAGEREYNPLEDSMDLISRVVSGKGAAPLERQTPQIKEEAPHAFEKVVELKKTANITHKPAEAEQTKDAIREEYVILKFNVPRSDFVAAKRIVSMLENELHGRIELSNLGRGWLTRLITAEKEILEAAKHQQKLKSPNTRDPLQVAEVDHALAVIQSVAFKRAESVK